MSSSPETADTKQDTSSPPSWIDSRNRYILHRRPSLFGRYVKEEVSIADDIKDGTPEPTAEASGNTAHHSALDAASLLGAMGHIHLNDDHPAEILADKNEYRALSGLRQQEGIFALKFSLEDIGTLVCGSSDGEIKVFNIDPHAETEHHKDPEDFKHQKPSFPKRRLSNQRLNRMPITSIAFRPTSNLSKTKNIFLAATADGHLDRWNCDQMESIYHMADENNVILSVDYRSDGIYYATGSQDHSVCIYDENTKQLVHEYKSTILSSLGHSSSVYCVKWAPTIWDHNILVSGGWDRTVRMWDIRAPKAVRTIFGPYVCGESLDISKTGLLLAGSWTPKVDEQLCEYNLSSGIKERTIPWVKHSDNWGSMVYSCHYSPNQKYILAAGSRRNQVKVWDRSQVSQGKEPESLGLINFDGSVFSSAWNKEGNMFAVGGQFDQVRVFHLKEGLHKKDDDANDVAAVTEAITEVDTTSDESKK